MPLYTDSEEYLENHKEIFILYYMLIIICDRLLSFTTLYWVSYEEKVTEHGWVPKF